MRIWLYICILVLTLGTAPANATTMTEARECFAAALTKAKAGATLADLVAAYLNVESVAMAAARNTPYRTWDTTPESVRGKLRSLILAELADSTGFTGVNLDSVKLVGRGKARGKAYELSGSFKSRSGTDTFSLVITTATGRCQFIDAVWNNVTLSIYW